MNRKVAEMATKIGSAGYGDLALELIAAEEKAEVKKWHKIVAKIPGVCAFVRMKDRNIQRDLDKAKDLIESIKKLEKKNPDSGALRDLYIDAILLIEPPERATDITGWGAVARMVALKRRIKKAGGLKWYIKTSEFILKMKKKGEIGPLSIACKELKEKKKGK